MKPDPIKSPPGQDTTCDGALRWRAGRRTLLANRPFLVALALGASALVVLYSVPPQQSSLYPRCLLHQWTGWQCPGCGGLRAAHELLHGRVLQAFHLNALCVLALPIASLYALRNLTPRAGRHRRLDWLAAPWWLWTLGAVALIFTLARNAV